jgi:hypothetical protein
LSCDDHAAVWRPLCGGGEEPNENPSRYLRALRLQLMLSADEMKALDISDLNIACQAVQQRFVN